MVVVGYNALSGAAKFFIQKIRKKNRLGQTPQWWT